MAVPGGPWRLTFAHGRLENLSFFFIEIINAGHLDFTSSGYIAPLSLILIVIVIIIIIIIIIIIMEILFVFLKLQLLNLAMYLFLGNSQLAA